MARLEVADLHKRPDLHLALINHDFPTGPLPADVMHAVIANPAYWSFCWGSGLALARLLFTEPAWVRDKVVLDLGCGSGVAGIAASLAGAAHVIGCDTDPDARLATEYNSRLNGVSIELLEDLSQLVQPVDLVLLADVLYDRSNFALLDAALGLTTQLLVADSRVRELPPRFQMIGEAEALTVPNLGEFDEYRQVRFFYADSRSNPATSA